MSAVTEIQRATCAHFRITMEELRGPTRGPLVIAAKHIARYLERQAGRSYPEIAAIYGLSDHGAVMASCNHVAARIKAGDEFYTGPVAAIEEAIRFARSKAAASVFDSMLCPTCNAPVIRELQRQVAELTKTVNELRGAQ